jgi:hypothetical protein
MHPDMRSTIIDAKKLTPIDHFAILVAEIVAMPPEFRRANHSTIVRMWRDYRAAALSSLMPPA